jgi:hypothetical protein
MKESRSRSRSKSKRERERRDLSDASGVIGDEAVLQELGGRAKDRYVKGPEPLCEAVAVTSRHVRYLIEEVTELPARREETNHHGTEGEPSAYLKRGSTTFHA